MHAVPTVVVSPLRYLRRIREQQCVGPTCGIADALLDVAAQTSGVEVVSPPIYLTDHEGIKPCDRLSGDLAAIRLGNLGRDAELRHLRQHIVANEREQRLG